LDIEGAEYDVLKTIPWDKVDVTALLVEVSDFYTSGKLNKWISRLYGGGLWFHFLTLKFNFFCFLLSDAVLAALHTLKVLKNNFFHARRKAYTVFPFALILGRVRDHYVVC
jgi:hypothetical protein